MPAVCAIVRSFFLSLRILWSFRNTSLYPVPFSANPIWTCQLCPKSNVFPFCKSPFQRFSALKTRMSYYLISNFWFEQLNFVSKCSGCLWKRIGNPNVAFLYVYVCLYVWPIRLCYIADTFFILSSDPRVETKKKTVRVKVFNNNLDRVEHKGRWQIKQTASRIIALIRLIRSLLFCRLNPPSSPHLYSHICRPVNCFYSFTAWRSVPLFEYFL